MPEQRDGRVVITVHDGPAVTTHTLDLSGVPDGVEVIFVPDWGGSYGGDWSEGWLVVPDQTVIPIVAVPVGAGYSALYSPVPGRWFGGCPGLTHAKVMWWFEHARSMGGVSGHAYYITEDFRDGIYHFQNRAEARLDSARHMEDGAL